MRTAEEILKENFAWFPIGLVSEQHYDKFVKQCITMINETRKEVIDECAERARSEWVRYGTNMGHAVDKQSVLNLKDELK